MLAKMQLKIQIKDRKEAEEDQMRCFIYYLFKNWASDSDQHYWGEDVWQVTCLSQ